MADLNDAIQDIELLMPLMEEMTNPALKKRHWLEILEIVGALEELCPSELEKRAYIEKALERGEVLEVNDEVQSSVCCLIWNFGQFSQRIICIFFTCLHFLDQSIPCRFHLILKT